MSDDLPALTIWQPWAWLIAEGHKDIENRSWPTRFRGRFLIHAGKTVDARPMLDICKYIHPLTGEHYDVELPDLFRIGGIIGEAEIVDCVTTSESPWFVGRYGFVIRNAKPLPFRTCRGLQKFFQPDFASKKAQYHSIAPVKQEVLL